jgi:hypothetical protein
MIEDGTMILNGIEMPLLFDKPSDEDTKLATRVHEIVSETLLELGKTNSNLACEPDVSIYVPDSRCGFDRNYYSVTVYGGLNGEGAWSNYFNSLSKLLTKLESIFEDVWVIEFTTDCTDDAFGVKVGIYLFMNQLEGRSEEEQ